MLYEWNIVGHQQQLTRLESDIKTNNLSHAYLFSGPRQTGKFRIARIFASILQCGDRFSIHSKLYKQIIAGGHPDTVLMKDDGDSLKIDTIRKMIVRVNLTTQSNYRLILIENIERMPTEAQNSFLKTLEEPPDKTVFVLTTNRPNHVLPTIRSRVRHCQFFNVSDETLMDFLQKKFPRERAHFEEIINIAQGRPGLAISLVEHPEALSHQRDMYAKIEEFFKRNNLANKFRFADEITDDSSDDHRQLDLFFDAFTRYLRKLLLEYTEQDHHPLKSRFGMNDIVNLFEYLEKTSYLIERNINKKLALENLLIQTEK